MREKKVGICPRVKKGDVERRIEKKLNICRKKKFVSLTHYHFLFFLKSRVTL